MKTSGFVRILFQLVVFLTCIFPLNIYAVQYNLIDLGTIGGSDSFGRSINDSGEVTGESYTTDDTAIHAFVWDAVSGFQDIHLSGGYFYSTGASINNSTQVTGITYFDSERHGFVWDTASGMQDIGTLGGHYSEGNGINNSGQITGYSNNVNDDYHAFVWDAANGMQDIGTLGTTSRGFAINDNGQVTGYSTTTEGTRAFIWDAVNGMHDIGTLGGSFTSGEDINSSGQVAGSSNTVSGELHAFLWDPIYGMTDLGNLGEGNSFGRGINSSGIVVGESFTIIPGEIQAFRWDPINGMQNLCVITDCTSNGWASLRGASDINDKGDIVGTGIKENGDWHAFVAFVSLDTVINIDILPKKEVNAINLNNKGSIQVAVLSTDQFPAYNVVNPDTVEFGPDGASATRHKVKDVNRDGLPDMVFYFKIKETGIECGDTEATLVGETYDGSAFEGVDSIVTKGCG